MNNLNILVSVLVHPYYAFRRGSKSLGLPVVVVALAVWSIAVSNSLMQGISTNPSVFIFTLISQLVVTLLFILVAAALWHLVSEIFNGKGKVSELFPRICLSFLPYIFLIPIALIINFSGAEATHFWPFFRFVIFLWVISLQIFSLRILYELSGPVAAFSYFVPFLAVIMLFFFFFLLMTLLLIATASQAFMGLLPALNLY